MRSTIPHIVSWLFMWPPIPHIVSWLFMWPPIHHTASCACQTLCACIFPPYIQRPVHARRYVHAYFHHTCSVLCMLDTMCMHVSTIHTASCACQTLCACIFPPYIQRPVHARRYVHACFHHTSSVLCMLDAMCMHISTIHTASCACQTLCACMFPPYMQRPVHARRYVHACFHHTVSWLLRVSTNPSYIIQDQSTVHTLITINTTHLVNQASWGLRMSSTVHNPMPWVTLK